MLTTISQKLTTPPVPFLGGQQESSSLQQLGEVIETFETDVIGSLWSEVNSSSSLLLDRAVDSTSLAHLLGWDGYYEWTLGGVLGEKRRMQVDLDLIGRKSSTLSVRRHPDRNLFRYVKAYDSRSFRPSVSKDPVRFSQLLGGIYAERSRRKHRGDRKSVV